MADNFSKLFEISGGCLLALAVPLAVFGGCALVTSVTKPWDSHTSGLPYPSGAVELIAVAALAAAGAFVVIAVRKLKKR